MKKRSTEILQRLLKNPKEELELRKLTAEYRISEKTLKSDIQEMMEFTREADFNSALFCDSHRLGLTDRQCIRNLMDAVYSMDPYQYKMSPEERKVYITIVLLYHNGYYSMQQLADELYVTRNTIINDCRLVDDYLKKYEISFVAKSKKGILVRAEEEKIQNLLIHMFQELIPSIRYEETFFVRFITRKAGFIYTLKDVIYHMNCFSGDNNTIFAKDIFFEIAICIFIMVNRLQQTEHALEEQDLSSLQLDTIGKMVSYVVEELGYSSLGRGGVLAIERQILLRSLHPQIQSMNDFELYCVICHFLLEISREIDVDIQADQLLIESLISHIKGMNNWSDGDCEWNMGYEASGDFLRLRNLAEGKFYILENYLKYMLTSRMKDSIIIHICAALLRGRKNSNPLAVIISCPGSMATSKYLEAQVKNYFNFYVAGTMTTRQVEEAKGHFEDADFIISTVPIQDSVLPVIVVSPLITVEDINNIQNLAFRHKRSKLPDTRARFPILSKIYAIYESGNTQKIEYLNRELQQILEDSFYIESRLGTDFALLNMLEIKYIKVVEEKLEWRQAMKTASEDLIRDGYFDERYVQEAIGNVEEYGSYIIVNKGVALAHASKEAGVYEDGISLLVAREGITFEEGDTVYLLFFFSQKGDTDYLDLFKEVIKLGKNQEDMEKIRKLPEGRQVYQAIWEILSRD